MDSGFSAQYKVSAVMLFCVLHAECGSMSHCLVSGSYWHSLMFSVWHIVMNFL